MPRFPLAGNVGIMPYPLETMLGSIPNRLATYDISNRPRLRLRTNVTFTWPFLASVLLFAMESHINFSKALTYSPPVQVVINDPKVINILGLFELSGCEMSANGRLELLAAQLAIKMVNEGSVIPGYRLQLIFNDTMCNAGNGIHAYFHALFLGPKIHFLLGPSHDEVAIEIARATPYWAMLQISAGATSPSLSDRNHFRYFFRTVTPDQSHNEARRAFFNHYNWRHAATINENLELYALAMNELVRALASNITFVATGSIGETKIKSQLALFKEKDVRIIIAAFSVEFAKKVFCEAFHLALYGSRYVWFIPGSYPSNWWKNRGNETSCTDKEIETAIAGYITVTTSDALMDNKISSAGITHEFFMKQFHGTGLRRSSYSPQALAFDAIWAFAFTLRKSIPVLARKQQRLEDFHYKNWQMAETFKKILSTVDFDGISGPIRFSGPDRLGVSVFRQFNRKELHTIAMYYPEQGLLQFNCSNCQPVSWIGSRTPADRRRETYIIETVEPQVLFGIAAVASLGIVVACSFLCFNFHFRSQKFIKLSSPKLNNTTALGCCLVYVSVITLGIDFAVTGDIAMMKTICQMRIFLLSTGFSVAFGSLFLKTFRVHQIFRKAARGVIKSKLLRDNQLLCGVGVLFVIDCVFLSVWFLVDPIRVDLKSLAEVHSETDPDVILKRRVEVCSCDYMNIIWLPCLYVYKGLLLLAGIFLTFETRHVKIPALNDSQAVGLSIYNVVICSIIAFALTQIIFEHQTLHFVLISALAIATTTGTLCFLFLPKIFTITKSMGVDPLLSVGGLKVECNTRRLAVDDPRERFVRAEIQNRVYTRDMVEIDTEIQRLEKLISLPILPYMKISEELLRALPEYYVDDESTVERYKLAEREKNAASMDRIYNMRTRLPMMKKNKLEQSLSLSDRSENNLPFNSMDGNPTTIVMETEDGNITLVVQNHQRSPPNPNAQAMAKFRKAMIRYKFIAIKPTGKTKPPGQRKGVFSDQSYTEPSSSETC